MAKVRVVYRPDGTVAVIYPVLWSRKIDILTTFMQPFPESFEFPVSAILWIMQRQKRIIEYFTFYTLPITYLETEQEWLSRTFTKAMTTKGYDRELKIKIPNPLDGLPYDDIDSSELPTRDKNRDKWRGLKGNGVHIDNTIVLPREVVEQKQAELDTELEKQNPDPVTVIKLSRDIEKLRIIK